MDDALENCFIIPVINDFIVYAPLVGISALVNRAGILELQEQIHLIKENKGKPESKLYDLAKDIIQSQIIHPVRKEGDLNPEFLGIIPTRSCNGACNYCDFGAAKATSKKMSYQLAAEVVNWYVSILKQQNRNIFEIHFFGGEPMIARDIIEVVNHRARLLATEENLITFFEISTNGQFGKADALFLGDYFDKVILSFDGFKEVQNKHRPLKGNKSSFENTVETAKIISKSNAQLCIRCCVSSENVQNMEEFTTWLCNNLKLTAINFEILCSSPQTNSFGLYPPDPVEFAIHFQKSREIAIEYGVDVVYASDISGQPLVSSCPVGKDTAIVTPDGKISNCYLMPEKWEDAGLELSFGNIKSNGDINLEQNKIEFIRNMVENKPRCENCFCQWSCAGGCHVGITYPGSSLNYDNFCIQTRLISTFSLLMNMGLDMKINELLLSPIALQKISAPLSDKLEALKN